MSKKIILTYGTFDLFHVGHLRLLQRLKSLGDELIVGVSTDEFNALKGKKTIIPFDQRAEIINGIKCVDKVIPESTWAQKRSDIKELNASIFAMGHDWEGKFDELKDICQVVYLPRTNGISSTELKEKLKQISEINIQDINTAFEILQRLKNDFE